MNKYLEEVEKELDKKFLRIDESDSFGELNGELDEIKSFLRTSFLNYQKQVREEIEKMRYKRIKKVLDGYQKAWKRKGDLSPQVSEKWVGGHNSALSDLLSLPIINN